MGIWLGGRSGGGFWPGGDREGRSLFFGTDVGIQQQAKATFKVPPYNPLVRLWGGKGGIEGCWWRVQPLQSPAPPKYTPSIFFLAQKARLQVVLQ